MWRYSLLNRGDPFREITLQVWDYSKRGGHTLIGEIKTSLNKLREFAKNKVPIHLIKEDGVTNAGKLIIKEVTNLIGPSFLHKISEGFKLNMIFGVDCTYM